MLQQRVTCARQLYASRVPLQQRHFKIVLESCNPLAECGQGDMFTRCSLRHTFLFCHGDKEFHADEIYLSHIRLISQTLRSASNIIRRFTFPCANDSFQNTNCSHKDNSLISTSSFARSAGNTASSGETAIRRRCAIKCRYMFHLSIEPLRRYSTLEHRAIIIYSAQPR